MEEGCNVWRLHPILQKLLDRGQGAFILLEDLLMLCSRRINQWLLSLFGFESFQLLLRFAAAPNYIPKVHPPFLLQLGYIPQMQLLE